MVAGSPRIILCCAALFGMCYVSAAEAQHPPIKRALLIGIDEYESPDIRDLGGAVNDVELMQSVLIGKFAIPAQNIRVLVDEEATRKGILNAIREHLIEADPPADIAILQYSGHGSQMEDRSSDELDHLDETIVPHDARVGDIFDINDDEINGLLMQLSEVTPNVTFIMDSCHSGSVARAAEVGAAVRQAPPDRRPAPVPESFAIGERGALEGPSDFRLPAANYVLLSGSQANELSHEALFGDQRNGALTYFLAQALRQAGASTTYRDIMDSVNAEVAAKFPSQHPDREGTGLDTVVFGDHEILPRPFVLVEPDEGSRVKIEAGKVYGLTAGTLLDVYPAGTKQFDGATPPTVRVRVISVQDFEAEGQIDGQGTVAAHSRAVLQAIRPSEYYTGVYFHDPKQSQILQAAAKGLNGHESIRVVSTREDADIRVRVADGEIRLEGRDLQVLSAIPADRPNLTNQVIERINHWGRWFSILAIDNPSPSADVDLQIQRSGTPATEPTPDSIIAGSLIDITVTNRSSSDLYIIVLDLASDGSVCVLYPGHKCRAVDQSDALPSGGKLPLPRITSSVPDGRDMSVDIVKVIATTTKISPSVFQLGAVARALESALERYLRLNAQGLTRNLEPTIVEGWVTRARTLRVVRPTVVAPTYALHFSSAEEASNVSGNLSRSRSVCNANNPAGCYELEAMPRDPAIIEVRSPEARGGTPVTSIGEAFEDAYRLREETGAERAEPAFELELSRAANAPHPDSPEARGIGGARHDPRAAADTVWSLKHTRVTEAWGILRAAKDRAHGREAEGVVVAHPDTGYRKHEEIWSSNPDRSPVWASMGYDYFMNDNDPTDDLLTGQAQDNPAHGTGSVSAIISPEGCQLAGAVKCPTGVALGGRLVPLRTSRSVVHFNMGRLTRAILDASGTDRSRVKAGTDVMSIGMGGAPSWSLWKAVRKAEKAGYLIVAAAGNYVKTVVWPARFESVVGVAATNVGCRPWAHTSVGPAVDFSAPGESVWRATIKEGTTDPITGMGTGTTYATATTAGIAALWVARHKGSRQFESLKKKGELTRTFRSLVQQTSWRPGNRQPADVACDSGSGWNSSLMGSGIIDAAALLEQPLSAVVPRAAETPTTVQELPLWSSLYPEGTSIATARADYRRLFGLAADTDLERVAIYEAEVMHHYAMNEKVAFALDALAIRGDRSEQAFAQTREALRGEDLSLRLRTALPR